MFLYQEFFKAELEKRLDDYVVVDERIKTWFRTTYLTWVRNWARKGNRVLQTLYLGVPKFTNTDGIIKWADASEALRRAFMNDEQVMYLPWSYDDSVDFPIYLEALKDLAQLAKTKDLSVYSAPQVLNHGKMLIEKREKERRAAEMKVGLIEFWRQPGEKPSFAVDALLNQTALEVIGDDLMNCLRKEKNNAPSYIKSKVTYLGLKDLKTKRYVAIAEVQFAQRQVESHSDKVEKLGFRITSMLGVSNSIPCKTFCILIGNACQDIFGCKEVKQFTSPTGEVGNFIYRVGKEENVEDDLYDHLDHLLLEVENVGEEGETFILLGS